MWNLPRPGIEPVSPALMSRVFTTEPPGSPGHPLALILWDMSPGLSRPQAKEVGIGKEGVMTGAEVFWARQKMLLWQEKIARQMETYCRWSRFS